MIGITALAKKYSSFNISMVLPEYFLGGVAGF